MLERTTQRYPVRALSTPPDGSSILFVNRVAINNASVEETVAMSVKAGCTPRDDVLQGELNDAIFAASFGRLIRDEGPAVYRDPALFFRNTYPTDALRGLCQRVFGPLADPAEAGRFFRLSTGFGGGKTHALMSLWHLAENIADPTMGAHLLAPAGRPSEVRVVGLDEAAGPG